MILHLASLVLLLVVLAGLAVRRLYRLCYTFPAYLAAVWLGDFLILMWPAHFYQWSFWLLKETLYAVLKLAVALEIMALAYQAFPHARAAARLLVLGVLGALLVLLLMAPVPANAELSTIARELLRRVANGSALVSCGVWGLVLWYRLPMHPLHRAMLSGLVAYLVVFASAITVTLALGWDLRGLANAAEATAWALLLLYWSWAVWRRQPTSSDFIRGLQPWRDRV
jgi:hypothetical protein